MFDFFIDFIDGSLLIKLTIGVFSLEPTASRFACD